MVFLLVGLVLVGFFFFSLSWNLSNFLSVNTQHRVIPAAGVTSESNNTCFYLFCSLPRSQIRYFHLYYSGTRCEWSLILHYPTTGVLHGEKNTVGSWF